MGRRETETRPKFKQSLTGTQACKIYQEYALGLTYPLSPPSGSKALEGSGQRVEWLRGVDLGAGLIPWTEESGRLQSKGSQRVRHDWACPHALDWSPAPSFPSCVALGKSPILSKQLVKEGWQNRILLSHWRIHYIILNPVSSTKEAFHRCWPLQLAFTCNQFPVMSPTLPEWGIFLKEYTQFPVGFFLNQPLLRKSADLEKLKKKKSSQPSPLSWPRMSTTCEENNLVVTGARTRTPWCFPAQRWPTSANPQANLRPAGLSVQSQNLRLRPSWVPSSPSPGSPPRLIRTKKTPEHQTHGMHFASRGRHYVSSETAPDLVSGPPAPRTSGCTYFPCGFGQVTKLSGIQSPHLYST